MSQQTKIHISASSSAKMVSKFDCPTAFFNVELVMNVMLWPPIVGTKLGIVSASDGVPTFSVELVMVFESTSWMPKTKLNGNAALKFVYPSLMYCCTLAFGTNRNSETEHSPKEISPPMSVQSLGFWHEYVDVAKFWLCGGGTLAYGFVPVVTYVPPSNVPLAFCDGVV
jgi:hypothetical protein